MAIESCLQYSVSQLRELKDQKGYHHQTGQVRLVPNQVLQTARVLGNKDIGYLPDVLDYFTGAFYLFQSCVAGFPEKGAPLVELKSIYEWPRPKEFSWVEWQNIGVYGKLMKKSVTSGVVVRRAESELDQMVMNMERTFPFKIPSLDNLGFVQDGTEWQQGLLNFFNPLSNLSASLKEGNVSEIEARSKLFLVLHQLSKTQTENLQVLNQ